MADALETSHRNGCTLVRMQDGKVNALSREFLGTLAQTLEQAVAEERPIIVTGSGRAFSAGLDLTELPTLDREGLADLLERFEAVVEPLLRAPVPVVAALNGFAVAGGAIIALSCDYRVAHPEAEIGATELRVGIPFPPTDVTLFQERLPPQTIRRTILRPRRVKGNEARSLGWVDRLDEDPVGCGLDKGRLLHGTNPGAFASLKATLNAPVLAAWERFAQGGAQDYLDRLTSEETQQAVAQGISQVLSPKA